LLVTVALSGCRGPRRAWVPLAPASTPALLESFGVIALSTPLSTAPDRAALGFWGAVPSRVGVTQEPTYAAVRLVGGDAAWVEVETLSEPGREPGREHCVDGIAGLEPFRLRLFVPGSALVPVTQREIAREFADGTRVELARGVPIGVLGRGTVQQVRLGALRVPVELGPMDVGVRYLPSEPQDESPSRRVLRGELLAAGVPVLGESGRVESVEARDVPVYAEVPRGSERSVELRPRCGRLVLRVPAHGVGDAAPILRPEGDLEERAGAAETPPAKVVSAGARVYWRDGRDAGVVARDVTLGDELEGSSGRRCFARALRPASEADPSPTLELCFDRHAVVDAGVGLARRLDAPR
jgi:hypothetical protein